MQSVVDTNPPSARGSVCEASGRSSDSGLPPRRLPGPRASGVVGGGASPLTAAGPSRTCTGFPYRSLPIGAEPIIGVPTRAISQPGLPVVALGGGDLRALVGPVASSSGLGVWDTCCASARTSPSTRSSALLLRALGRAPPALAARRRLRGQPTRCTSTRARPPRVAVRRRASTHAASCTRATRRRLRTIEACPSGRASTTGS